MPMYLVQVSRGGRLDKYDHNKQTCPDIKVLQDSQNS